MTSAMGGKQPGQVPKILWANVAKNVSINETHTQTEDRKQERKQGGTKRRNKIFTGGGVGGSNYRNSLWNS